MGVAEHIRHRVLRIAYECHGGGTLVRALATVERFVGKIVLHGIDHLCFNGTVRLLLIFVPGHYVPIAYKTKNLLVARHLHK